MPALMGYLLYYTPLSFIGDPFFPKNSDIGFTPAWEGIILTAIIYSIVYWALYFGWHYALRDFYKRD